MLDFLQYHLVTILTVLVILLVVLVNHYGCNKNLQLAQMQQLRIDKLLKASFTNYDGEFVMESPNVIKVYASGRESCLFAILGYAV